MLEFAKETKKTLTYIIPERIREELGDDGRIIDRIKVVSLPDRQNTRSVFLCTTRNDEIEEVAPTPMQACGLVTVLDGKFVLIHSEG